jgi:hypothetical protein
MKLTHSFLLACLGTASLCAQQAKPEVDQKSATNGEATASATAIITNNGKTEIHTAETRPGRRPAQAQPPAAPEQKPVAYIGVLTREVPPEMRSQFNLPEGFGLMVDEVMPDSPAQQAGLKMHDVLLRLDDQRLVNMEQLMLLVRSHKKGDNVTLTVITGGKESTIPVTLGEHVMPAVGQHLQYGFGGWSPHGAPFFRGDTSRGFENQSREFNEQMERFQKEMREYQQLIQEWARKGNQGPMPQPPMFNPPAGGEPRPLSVGHSGGNPMPPPPNPNVPSVQQFNYSESHAATTVSRRDDSGDYTLKREDGKATFTARPNGGTEQSWPINNEAERQAVPKEFREKLRMMDGAQSTIRIQVDPAPGNGHPPPAPKPGGASTPPSVPKGRGTSA